LNRGHGPAPRQGLSPSSPVSVVCRAWKLNGGRARNGVDHVSRTLLTKVLHLVHGTLYVLWAALNGV
jgi:hypothetical protein